MTNPDTVAILAVVTVSAVLIEVTFRFIDAKSVVARVVGRAIAIVPTFDVVADAVHAVSVVPAVLIKTTHRYDLAATVNAVKSRRTLGLIPALRGFNAPEIFTDVVFRALKVIFTVTKKDALTADAVISAGAFPVSVTNNIFNAETCTVLTDKSIWTVRFLPASGVNTHTIITSPLIRTVVIGETLSGVEAAAILAFVARFTIPVLHTVNIGYANVIFTQASHRTVHIGQAVNL